jgi:hypothetical protein
VSDKEDRVRDVEVREGSRSAIGPEGLDQGRSRRRGAQARIAVDMRGADTAFGDDRQRVVLLEHELARVVEAMGAGTELRDIGARPLDDGGHRLVP